MNYLNSSHTGKAARCLESAFGIRSTYARIEPMPEAPMPLHERVLYFIVYPAALAVLAWVLCN